MIHHTRAQILIAKRLINDLVVPLQHSTEAAEAINSFTSSSTRSDIRLQVQAYFTNYMAAIDLIGDAFCPNFRSQAYVNPFERKLIAGMQGQNAGFGQEAYAYIRKFRDSIVHRGLDSAFAAHHEGDRVLVECPIVVLDQKRKAYPRPCTYLTDLVRACNAGCNPVLLADLKAAGVFEDEAIVAYAEELYYTISQSPNVPAWVIKMRAGVSGQTPRQEWAEGIAASRASRIQHYLRMQ